MQKLFGLGIFWLVADEIASQLSPAAAGVMGAIVAIVVFGGLGSIILAAINGGDWSDHFGKGFSSAASGWAVTTQLIHWHLVNPRHFGLGAGAMGEAMVLNLAMVGVGMIPGISAISIFLNLNHEKMISPASTSASANDRP